MFVSFFPRPRPFFISLAVWLLLAILLWQFGASGWGGVIGLPQDPAGTPPIIGISVFWSKPFLWFDIYFWAAVAGFALFWQVYAPHPWARWSVWGSALILFVTYLQVQVSVAINAWYGPFYDLIQTALSHSGAGTVTSGQFYRQLLTFSDIAIASITVVVLTHFFVSHYIFRWRTAMNDYYMAHWARLRGIEGAAQRVQDDTMRFATTLEVLGVALINSVMTLIAFLPVLTRLSADVTELPIFGPVPDALVIVAVVWSLFGTSFLALIGIRLPGLEFRNQLVEAAYRKELVYGEDEAARAQPPTMTELFGHIRHNYFRLYLHFMYFNIGRYLYLQVDVIFPYLVLAPTIIAGKITFGLLQQILSAFDQVRSSFQYLINAWTTIVELLSIYQRLRRFEAVIGGEPPGDQPISALSPAL